MPEASQTLGPWTVLEQLGGGSTGTVYRARRDGEVAALKVLQVRGLLRPGHLDAVWAALDTRLQGLARIAHPSVLRILDWGRDDPEARLWLAMEELHGEALDPGRGRPPDEVLRLLGGLAAGLAVAHRAGEIHGDIKPENLFVEPDGRPVLVDFALPLSVDEDAPYGAVPLGSPRWLAPECFDGASASPAADIYALGQSLHETLLGTPAFEVHGRRGPSRLLALREAKLAAGPLDPGPLIRDPLRQALILCTHPDPEQRPTAPELASLVPAEVR